MSELETIRLQAESEKPSLDSGAVALPVVEVPVVRIAPSAHWPLPNLRELWESRELVYFLVWRDIKVRYKQTVLGAAWAIIQPLFNLLLFSVFFGRLAKMPSDGLPYPLFSYTALVPWTFFAQGLTQASNSLVGNPDLVKKVYFPRLAMPLARVLACLLDFCFAFLSLLAMIIYYKVELTLRVAWLPMFVLLALVTSLGVSLWFSAMNVLFRDVQYVMPFLVQAWLFATPVVYPSSLLSEPWRTLYGINPMVGVVEGFRWALLGSHTAPGPMVIVSSLVALAMLVSGLFYFRRMERTFVDIL